MTVHGLRRVRRRSALAAPRAWIEDHEKIAHSPGQVTCGANLQGPSLICVFVLGGARGRDRHRAISNQGTRAPALAACYEGAVTQRVGLGPMRGRPVIKLGVPLAKYLASARERVERGGMLWASRTWEKVLRGLSAGDRVIVHPSDRVQDGVRVVIR